MVDHAKAGEAWRQGGVPSRGHIHHVHSPPHHVTRLVGELGWGGGGLGVMG